MGRVRLLWGVPCCNSPSSHVELCPRGLEPPSSETLPTRPASLPPAAPGPKEDWLHQLPACYCFISSHRQDHLWMQGRIMFRRFLGDASNSKSPEIRQERKLAFPTRQLCYTLMEDSCVSPSPPKCTSSVLILQLWGFLFREVHMHPFDHNLVSRPF